MSKKSMLCLLMLALLFASANVLVAQEEKDGRPQIYVPELNYYKLQPSEIPNLRNVEDMSAAELEDALKRTCSEDPLDSKAPTFCEAWTGINCTGVRTPIPCGAPGTLNFVNGSFQSLRVGCRFTYFGVANFATGIFRITVGTAPGQIPDNSCVNAGAFNGGVFGAVGCGN